MDVLMQVMAIWYSQKERDIVRVLQQSPKDVKRERRERGESGWCKEVSYIPR